MTAEKEKNPQIESSKKHIMIVDEHESTRFELTSELGKVSKYQILAAPSVSKALEQISRNPPSLLITSLFLNSSDVVQLVVRTRVLFPSVTVVGIYDSKTCLQKDLQLQRKIMQKLGVVMDFDLAGLSPELCNQLVVLAEEGPTAGLVLQAVVSNDGEVNSSQSVNTPEQVNNSDNNSEDEATLADSMPTKVVQR